MIDLLDITITHLLKNGVKFSTIILDFRSYEQLHNELGQSKSRLTGYKGYTIEMSLEDCFSNNYFKIEVK